MGEGRVCGGIAECSKCRCRMDALAERGMPADNVSAFGGVNVRMVVVDGAWSSSASASSMDALSPLVPVAPPNADVTYADRGGGKDSRSRSSSANAISANWVLPLDLDESV